MDSRLLFLLLRFHSSRALEQSFGKQKKLVFDEGVPVGEGGATVVILVGLTVQFEPRQAIMILLEETMGVFTCFLFRSEKIKLQGRNLLTVCFFNFHILR